MDYMLNFLFLGFRVNSQYNVDHLKGYFTLCPKFRLASSYLEVNAPTSLHLVVGTCEVDKTLIEL